MCPNCDDGLHCACWYQGAVCCYCQEQAPVVHDLSVLYINISPFGASTVVRNNATGEVMEIPGSPPVISSAFPGSTQ